MAGLLSGVLPAVFSAGNKLKRQIGGLLSDPVGTVQQQVGLLNDKAGAFNQLTAQAAQEHVNSLKTGGGMGQAQMKLANTLADSYNPVGMFVGVNAKTADKAMLAKAQQMLDAGEDNREVWAQTGWFRGPDGKMRFEIDDSKSVPGQRLYSWGESTDLKQGNSTVVRRQKALLHPDLSAAYPDTKSIGVILKPGDSGGGSYMTDFDNITVGTAKNGAANRSTMLHELQHAIQKREGFAGGGTPESSYGLDVADALKAVRKEKAAIGIDPYAIQNRLAARYQIPAEELAKYKEWQGLTAKEDGLLKSMASPYEAYKRLAGEAEARATQARMNLTAEQRRALFPLDSYDVPIDSLIFK